MSLPAWRRFSLKWGLLIFSSALLGSVYVTRLRNGGERHSAKHQHLVKTIVMPSRVDLVESNLQPVFSDLEIVRAFEKDDADLEMMESAKLLDRSWDSDGKLRTTYSVSYPQSGEVSCTLSHRRVLESFLASEADTMLVLEDDAVPLTENVTQEIEEIMKVAPEGWGYINLGRCWDVCDARRKKVVASFNVSNASHLSKKGTLERSLGWEMCTHAYLVTRTGAEKLLQYTQPILLPYDHTVNILGRQGLLDVYFTSPRLFTQSEESESMLRNKADNVKPVCDPNGDKRAAALETEVPFYDRYLMAKINRSPVQSMVSIETMLLQEAETPVKAEEGRTKLLSNLCSRGKDEFCVRTTHVQREIAQHCTILGGGEVADDALEDYPASMEFLDELDLADLDGVVIWGLRPEDSHSHRYVHSAIHKAVEFALERSPVPRHLCYVKETPGFDLGSLLYRDSSRGKLARSLVFTSPKHMTWSEDMGFLTLPIEESSLYVFHGMTPRPHEALKKIGRAVEWETWGPDGHVPLFDSQEFIRGDVWKPHEGCKMDEQHKHFECPQERLVVMPWATEFLPTEIMENKKRIEEAPVIKEKQQGMHFIGTIWYCNLDQFVGFTRGCLQENVTVTRHGKWMLSNSIDALKELPNFETKDDLDDTSMEEVFRESNSIFAPAFQGSCHLDSVGGQSYIADRLLNVIAMGMYPMTNNLAAIEFLGNSPAIVFNSDEEELCHAASIHETDPQDLPKLMDLVAKEHTYASRLNTILRFFRGPVQLTEGSLVETRAHLEGPVEDKVVAAVPLNTEVDIRDVEVEQARKLELQPIPTSLEDVVVDETFHREELHEFDLEGEQLDERDLKGVPSSMGSMPSLTSTSDDKYKKKPKHITTRSKGTSDSQDNSSDERKKKRQAWKKKQQKSGTTRSPFSTSPSDDGKKKLTKKQIKLKNRRKKQSEREKREQENQQTPKPKKKLTRKQIMKRKKNARLRKKAWGSRRTLLSPEW